MNILIVDDTPSIRHNTADWFRLKGYTVMAVPCAFAARDLINSGSFHVEAMILDLQLPCGQGTILINWLKEGGAKGVPIVIWTAKSQSDVDLPGYRVVFKPCNNEELETAVLEEVERMKSLSKTQVII